MQVWGHNFPELKYGRSEHEYLRSLVMNSTTSLAEYTNGAALPPSSYFEAVREV